MRKIILVLLIPVLIFGACGRETENLTWAEIYQMIDNGEFSSKIDQAIFDIGPETHPASVAVSGYYDACFSKEYEKAWGFIKEDSPFMANKESLDKFIELWEKSIELFEYGSPIIRGLYISKEVDDNRDIEVIFSIKIKTIDVDNEYASNGRFKMVESTDGWKIFDFESEVEQE